MWTKLHFFPLPSNWNECLFSPGPPSLTRAMDTHVKQLNRQVHSTLPFDTFITRFLRIRRSFASNRIKLFRISDIFKVLRTFHWVLLFVSIVMVFWCYDRFADDVCKFRPPFTHSKKCSFPVVYAWVRFSLVWWEMFA